MTAIDRSSVGWDGHVLLTHNNEAERRKGLVAWVGRGLELDAKILYTEAADTPVEETFIRVLEKAGIDVRVAVGTGQIQVVPASLQAYDHEWQSAMIDQAFADGYPTVRWSAEAGTAWGVMSQQVHAEIEWSTDELCRQRPVSILCQYPAGLIPETLQEACAMHASGVREALLATYPLPGGIALAGEADPSNARVLACALAAAAATIRVLAATLIVDLSGLRFLDVAGTRALMAGTTAYRQNGGRVRLRAPGQPVERVLRVLGVHRNDGFVLEGSP